MKLFLENHWPGNVRELKNVVKKAVLLTEDYEFITSENIFLESKKNPIEIPEPISLNKGETLQEKIARITAEAEKEIIVSALQKEKYNKTKVARKLGIDRKTLYSKLKKLGIE